MPRGGTRHCWSDQHRHRGAGADVSSSYPPAPWMLRSLLGTWGGTLAQQEVGGGGEITAFYRLQSRRGLGEAVSRGRHELTDSVRVSARGIPWSWEKQAEGFKWYHKTISFYFFHMYV